MWLTRWLLLNHHQMNIKYMLKNKSIYYRIRNGRDLSVLRKLPFEIMEKDWSKIRECAKPKEYNALNVQLSKFKTFILSEYNLAITNDKQINLEWVKKKQDVFFNTTSSDESYKIYLKKYIDFYYKTERPASNNFMQLINHIPSTTKIIEMDLKWVEEFSKEKLKTYAESTIGKHIQQLKQVLKHAERNGIRIKRSALDFRIKKYSSINTYLNVEEINSIFDYEFNNDRLVNVKRLFLIGCTTGMRVSDLMRVKNYKITNGFIEIQAKKTKQPLIIPIDPRVKEFFSKNRIISDVKFNKYLKEMCQIVGINEPTKGYLRNKQNKRVLGTYPKYKLITSHTMRRSFATNLYGKVPTVVIMAITGHTTEKSFLTYIKKPQRDFAEQLKRYYLEKNKNGT